MILCHECGSASDVTDSRKHANTVRRRRECQNCHNKWTTYEVSSNFMSYVSEIPAILASLSSSSSRLAIAVEDYDLEAFGEVDRVGRSLRPQQPMPPRCPRCASTDISPEIDNSFKLPRMRCISCSYVGTEAAFKKKWR